MLSQRKSPRYQGYDYTSTGSYFVTICTKNREEYFGKIKDGKMILNEIGRIIETYRYEIPNHFDHVELGEFIVMPNHIHGIVIIKSDNNQTDRRDAITARPNNKIKPTRPINQTDQNNQFVASEINGNDTDRMAHDAIPTLIKSPQYGSLGYIVNQFKGLITKFARKNNIPFERQSRFHDHIIRDEIELQRIQEYIRNNPRNVDNDTFDDK